MDTLISRKRLKRQDIFRRRIWQKYGYKLLSGERRTKQGQAAADFYAMNMTLKETQRALCLWTVSLISKERDAIIIIAINQGFLSGYCQRVVV